jgi:hypothetical protein
VYKVLRKMKITLRKRQGHIRSGLKSSVRIMRGQYMPSKRENVVYGDESGIDEYLHRRKA